MTKEELNSVLTNAEGYTWENVVDFTADFKKNQLMNFLIEIFKANGYHPTIAYCRLAQSLFEQQRKEEREKQNGL